MSRDTRFDKLESAVVDALRRAPGAEPSADLDARIRARAHAAVAKPARRPQPIWFSMAAGLVVLVGSGLALRIWQQVEHAPTALDAPTPAASAPVTFGKDDATTDSAPMDSAATESSQHAAPARIQHEPVAAAPAKPADQPDPGQHGAELQREKALVESKLEAVPGSSASAAIADPALADQLSPTPAARPFPAEPASIIAAREQAPTTASSVPVAATEMIAPAAPPAPMQAPAPASDAGYSQPASVGQAESARARSVEGATMTGRDANASDRPESNDEQARQLGAAEDLPVDPFVPALAAVREAIASGDVEFARRLAFELRRDYPQRELPKDVLVLVDAPR